MLKLLLISLVAAVAGGAMLLPGGRSEADSTTAEVERFTTYRAPAGPELTAEQMASRAAAYARRAGFNGPLAVVMAHSTFAQAHVAMMGEASSEADIAEQQGPTERTEEMRSPVWVMMMAAPAGSEFEPNNPARHNQRPPSGRFLALVADAHTGFVKEEYLGPTAPDTRALGPTVTTLVAGSEPTLEGVSATASERRNPKQGAIEGRLSPPHSRRLITVWTGHRKRVTTVKSLPNGTETVAGLFSVRVLAGRYLLTAPGCIARKAVVRARRTTNVVLRCR